MRAGSQLNATMGEISTIRQPLNGAAFDVVVIGGGVNGVAIARECARAGARTLVLEQNDFASGTTSRATRIIHGGLRYLEHGELGLVRESLRERERLLRSVRTWSDHCGLCWRCAANSIMGCAAGWRSGRDCGCMRGWEDGAASRVLRGFANWKPRSTRARAGARFPTTTGNASSLSAWWRNG